MKNRTVHVIVWVYEGGGVFNWYKNKDDLNKELLTKCQNDHVKIFKVQVPNKNDLIIASYLSEYLTNLNKGTLT